MNGANGNGNFYFDDFELDTARRLLKNRGEVVPLNAKAFDLFAVLVQNRGRVLSKNELLDTVWADQFVEENNLTVHIAALRKALGEKKGQHRYIVTVPGKGYGFVGELDHSGDHELVVESREIKRIVIDEFSEEAPPELLARPRLRVMRWLSVAASVAAVLAAGWFAASWFGSREARSFPLFTAKRFLTTGVSQRVAISRDGKSIAYTRRLKGLDSLWIGDIASGTSTQLTPESRRLHEMMEFSADGRTIYLTARDENHPEWTLMSISSFGGAVKDLVTDARFFSISGDGRRVAFFRGSVGEGKPSLYIADTETGGNVRVVYQPPGALRFALNRVSWSPSRNTVALALTEDALEGCDLYEIDLDSGAERRLGEKLCSNVSNFAWARDGSGIALTGKLSDAAAGVDVWLADAENWQLRRLTATAASFPQYSISASSDGKFAVLEGRNLPNISAVTAEDPSPTRLLEGSSRGEGAYGLSATPDGKILFTVRVDQSLTIWEMASDGSGARQLIPAQKNADDIQPNVTPDNKHIVFESNRSGLAEIWRANRDGSAPVKLTVGGDNSAPAVTRDGRFILYHAKRQEVFNIWRIPIDGGEAEALTTANCTWPDVSPDGRFFACVTGTASDWHRRDLIIYQIDGGEPVRKLGVTFNSALYNRHRWSPDGGSIIYKDEVEGLWRQPVDGGEPERLPGFSDIRVFHLTHDAEGRLIYSGGLQMRQIVILEPPEK